MRSAGEGYVRRLAMVVATCLVAGCDAIQGAQTPIVSSSEEIAQTRPYFSAVVVDRFYSPNANDRAGLDRKTYRDLVVGQRLVAIDTSFRDFEASLRSASVSTGLGGDIITLALGGFASVAGGARTKAALAAGITGITGARTSFDKNVFYEKTLPALLSEMRANRARILTDIRTKQQGTAEAYPLDAAILDVKRYEMAGNVEDAIASMTDKAKKSADQREGELQSLEIKRSSEDAAEIATPANQTKREALIGRIGKLSDGDAIVAAQTLLREDSVAGRLDPKGDRFVNGKAARGVLAARAALTKSATELKSWDAAIK